MHKYFATLSKNTAPKARPINVTIQDNRHKDFYTLENKKIMRVFDSPGSLLANRMQNPA